MSKRKVTSDPESPDGTSVEPTGDNPTTDNPNDLLTHNPDIPPNDQMVLPTAEELLALGPLPELSGDVATLLEGMKERGQEASSPVYRYAGEDLWRYGGNAYCSIPGIEGWRVLSEGVRLPEAGLMTRGSFGVLGITEPPGGSYLHIYATPDGPYLYRAATLAGEFYLDGTDWKDIQQSKPAPPGNVPSDPADTRPASELSVRIRRIRGLL